MSPLRFTSCLAPNHHYLWQAVAAYLRQRLALSVDFIDEIDWVERYRQLDQAQIDLAAICGAPYVRRRQQTPCGIELVVAPVFRGNRYAGRPIYFSDVVVHVDSPFIQFADLQGASWAFNEPGSLSGYHALHHHLARLGKTDDYFARIVQSGGHITSLQWIVERRVDCTALDSTVLEQALHDQPELQRQIRVIAVIGPHPHPPLVASAALAPALQQQIRQTLLTMHSEPTGMSVLAGLPIERFAAVTDSDYDVVRAML